MGHHCQKFIDVMLPYIPLGTLFGEIVEVLWKGVRYNVQQLVRYPPRREDLHQFIGEIEVVEVDAVNVRRYEQAHVAAVAADNDDNEYEPLLPCQLDTDEAPAQKHHPFDVKDGFNGYRQK